MSVKFKMANKTIFDQIPMAPAPLEKIHEILASGWLLETGFNTVEVFSPNKAWSHKVTLPVGTPVILETPQKLSQAQKLVCGQTLVKLINIVNDKWSNVQTDATLASMKSVNPELKHPLTNVMGATLDSDSLEKVTSGVPVKLKDADTMLQPVKGSDVGSVYRLIAKSDNGMRIAARLSGTKLSVRVEGPRTSTQSAALMECSLTPSPQGHVSGHYVLGQIAPSRVLGAILYDPRLSLTESASMESFLALTAST